MSERTFKLNLPSHSKREDFLSKRKTRNFPILIWIYSNHISNTIKKH